MKKASIARLFLLLAVLALSMTAIPGHAQMWFSSCPYESCSDYIASCQASGGSASYTYMGWCQDESYAFREVGRVNCSGEVTICAWW